MLRAFHSRREMHRAQAVSLICFWCALYYVLKQLSAYDAVSKDHSDLFAFIGCCFVSMVSITFLGFMNWPAVMKVDDGSSLFKKHPAGETLALLQFSFQLWDLFAAFYVPGFLKLEMVLHHGVSLLTDYIRMYTHVASRCCLRFFCSSFRASDSTYLCWPIIPAGGLRQLASI